MTTFWSSVLIDEEAVQTMLELGQLAAPEEACGVLMPTGEVVACKNSSTSPHDSYVLTLEEVTRAIERWLDLRADLGLSTPQEGDQINVVFWHTHPGGGVGPSRGDLRARVPGLRYVVVSLPDGPAVCY